MGNEELKSGEIEGWLQAINDKLSKVLAELREIKKEINDFHRDVLNP